VVIAGEDEVRGNPEQPQAKDNTPSIDSRTANTRLLHPTIQNDLPIIETFAEKFFQKGHIITVGTEAKMLGLNDRDQLSMKLVPEWVSAIRILIAKKTNKSTIWNGSTGMHSCILASGLVWYSRRLLRITL